MKNASPELILVGLLLFGLAVSGWFYGIHWKRVATGSKFSRGEELIIQLQDQIDVLVDENERLFREIRELSPDREKLPDSAGATVPGANPQTDPQSSDSENVELPR